jgi:hypothetical protein
MSFDKKLTDLPTAATLTGADGTSRLILNSSFSAALPGDLCDCFFRFPTKNAAMTDPIVGPLLIDQGIQKAFPLSVYQTENPIVAARSQPWSGSVNYLQQWWCMLAMPFPLASSIMNHPNLQFILDWQMAGRTDYVPWFGTGSVVITNNLTSDQLLILEIISPYATVLLPGTH